MTEREILSAIFGKRKVQKPIRKKRRKIVPAKGKTEWGRIYADGREVCDDSAAGKREYEMRTWRMVDRQDYKCKCMADFRIVPATFGHDIPRGYDGMNRDDRIWDAEGNPMNHAECWNCNGEGGSVRGRYEQ